jgi:hypothetical protein
MADNGTPEDFAAGIFRTAIAEGRAGELLDCLLEGGSCTVDPLTGKLMLATAEQIRGLFVLDLGPADETNRP